MAEKSKEKETRTVAPWRPFMGLTGWESDTDAMMEESFGRRMLPWWRERWLRTHETDIKPPRVDVFEEKDEIVVKAELPGIEKDDVEVNLTDHTLIIKGEKKKAKEVKDENYYRAERSYGTFLRALDLPKEVRPDKVKASFKNGILEVRMPKTDEAKAKEVKVKVD